MRPSADMHSNCGSILQQQMLIKSRARSVHAYDFFNLLTGPALLGLVDEHAPLHRERLYAPAETLSLFMAQTLSPDASCQATVNRHTVERVANELPPCSTATGAYCRARQRLPLSMIQSLVRATGNAMATSTATTWMWQDRPVKLLDGTTVSMPDTAANQLAFPQPRGQKPGLGFPIARVVGVLCLATGAVLDVAMGACIGKAGSEHALLREMMGSIKTGDVVLADRYYCAYFLIALLRARGADVVFQQHQRRSTDFRKGRRLGSKDHIVEWMKPKQRPEWLDQEQYDAMPDTQLIREVRVRSKVLVTTMLSSDEASKQALSALHTRRWDVELDLRNIKTTLGLDVLRCRSPQMTMKELWTGLLAYNLIRFLMARAAAHRGILPRQISFKHTLQLWLAWSHLSRQEGDDDDLLLVLIAQQRVARRPGRIEPRAVKRRPKPHPLLTTRRPAARAHVKRHGHAVKLK